MYAFCRVADDIVDENDAVSAAWRLAEHERALDAALAGTPEGPVFRELTRAVARYEVPERALRELVAGVAREQLFRIIRDAGKIPVERDALYNVVQVWN